MTILQHVIAFSSEDDHSFRYVCALKINEEEIDKEPVPGVDSKMG